VSEGLKLTVYFGERQRTGGRFLADALLDVFGRHEVQASVLLRGIEGFGLKHHLRTDRLLTLSEDLPLMAVAVDTRARIEGLIGEVEALERHGLVTLEPAQLAAGAELEGEAKLTVYLGRQERIDGVPAFVAVCDLLRRHGVDGATVLLGVDGTARGIRRRARFFARNADVPSRSARGSGSRPRCPSWATGSSRSSRSACASATDGCWRRPLRRGSCRN